ncbi:MAG: transpeptidase family protein [Fibrobacteria bacterium]|nr:transpeptidase family protein [Fibrobacteria bacterium]
MHNKRILTLGFVLALVWVGMAARVFHVQVLQKDEYAKMARKQSIRRNIIQPRRGEIFDRHGEKLVANASVELSFPGGNSRKRNERVRKLKRVAPFGHLAGQVLGNIGRDGYGMLGLEYDQDKVLRGVDGWTYARYDVSRHYHPGLQEERKEPIDGVDLKTTLDIDFQRIAEQALERGVKKVSARGGTVILVKPQTGDILAMASYPFYNPNRRSPEDMKGWRNSAISKVYEPGSTFKIVTTAAALEENKLGPFDTLFAENGEYHINGAVVKDTRARGRISFTQALAYSSNVCMVKASLMLSPQNFYQYIRSFGFGMKTGVPLPAEEGGYLKKVKNWSGRSQVTLAWGQEISTTPLQVVMACAAVANGGVLMKPRIILEKTDRKNNHSEKVEPRQIRRVISEATSAKLRKMLTAVVDYGTAESIKTDKYSIAGKTGTVEKINKETGEYMKGRFHSSFVGMVPADKPEYVCLVLIDEPEIDKYGGASAGPVFKEIMDRIITFKGSRLALGSKQIKEQVNNTNSKTPKMKLAGIFSEEFSSWGDSQNETKEDRTKLAVHELRHDGRMPDLRGISLRNALSQLRFMDVQVRYKGVGQVVKQSPAPGVKVKKGNVCRLTLKWNENDKK